MKHKIYRPKIGEIVVYEWHGEKPGIIGKVIEYPLYCDNMICYILRYDNSHLITTHLENRFIRPANKDELDKLMVEEL